LFTNTMAIRRQPKEKIFKGRSPEVYSITESEYVEKILEAALLSQQKAGGSLKGQAMGHRGISEKSGDVGDADKP